MSLNELIIIKELEVAYNVWKTEGTKSRLNIGNGRTCEVKQRRWKVAEESGKRYDKADSEIHIYFREESRKKIERGLE